MDKQKEKLGVWQIDDFTDSLIYWLIAQGVSLIREPHELPTTVVTYLDGSVLFS